MLNIIPVDETVKNKGVPLASKCSWCSQPQEESTLNLFFRSNIATQIWSELFNLLHFSNMDFSAVLEGVIAFLARPKIITTTDHLIRCTFMAVMWEVWCSRNRARLQAEALALRDGLSICCRKGITEVLVETDSLNLLQILTKQIACPWDFACIMQHIAAKTQKLEVEITHAPRETNGVADCLASFAISCPHFVIWDLWADLPTLVKEPYHFDKFNLTQNLDLPNIRIFHPMLN
ncbi:hypothetical protein Taro_047728 [Colocasia esculenta]|uniref:RNase H type-1 domain-containing protein n=1 Tax=Colocasia esculenta TaxID=4460 RepID=A0A843WTQ5_COLES|nr:hypothetical protein [Colocasia esculenta]